jgi:peptidoglycan/LPS O-acetylase OafA/YrhL
MAQRINYLDSARAFALLLGVIFHASLSFIPVFIGWAVMDINTSWIPAIFTTISHSFRLELFYLIAGFFSHMAFHRDGVRKFLNSRLVRILIPFLVGWLILRPLVVSGWTMGGQSMRGDVSIMPSLIDATKSFLVDIDSLLIGTHLWFLYYLILITAMVIGARGLLSTNQTIFDYLVSLTDKSVQWICRTPWSLVAVIIPIASCLWFMNGWGMDTPDKSLTPHLPTFIIYNSFFVLGWVIHRNKQSIDNLTTIVPAQVMIALLAIIASVYLSNQQMNYSHPNYQWLKFGFVISYSTMMWLLVLLTLGLFKKILNKNSKSIRYMADASYWMYLIHLPLVIWLQIAVAELTWHWSIKWFTVSLLTVALSLITYDLLVRNSFIGSILNGRKKPSILLSAGQ